MTHNIVIFYRQDSTSDPDKAYFLLDNRGTYHG